MAAEHISIGRLGEDLVCLYLANKGMKILERNFRRPWGEIDIIARDKGKTLVFAEVKTIAVPAGADPGSLIIAPEENLTVSKLKKVQRMAMLYANSHEELVDENRGWRVDLVAIAVKAGTPPADDEKGLRVVLRECDVKHFQNVFL